MNIGKVCKTEPSSTDRKGIKPESQLRGEFGQILSILECVQASADQFNSQISLLEWYWLCSEDLSPPKIHFDAGKD